MESTGRTLLDVFAEMARHRAFEEVAGGAHADGRLPGLLHLSTGAEGAVAGVIGELDEADRIFSTHRPHGHFLASGESPGSLYAELAGKETGICRGRAGSMHLMGRRAVLATGVVGGTLPIAVGHSLAQDGAIAVVFFGDGAVQAGVFHESLNLAALWKAPVLFVCENNGYAEFSAREEHTPVANVADHAAAYGIAAAIADGSDVTAVIGLARELISAVRGGGGPALLELAVTRLRPHYEGGAAPRPDADGADPLATLARRLENDGSSADSLGHIREAAVAEMEDALASALAGPEPDPRDDLRIVFARAPADGRAAATAVSGDGTMIAAARTALAAVMEADEDVVILGEDVAAGGPFGLTRDLADVHGTERVRNTPISEGAVMGVAVGLALAGRKPLVDLMFDDFLTLASDQLFNHAAKIHFMSGGTRSVPLCVWTTGGAGTRWGAQHSQRMDGWIASVPGLKVLAPTTPAMAAASLAAGIEDPDPVVVLADRTLLYRRWTLPNDDASPWHNRLVRSGSALTVAASGRTVLLALEALDELGLEADVVDLQRIAPLDVSEIVASLARTSRLLVAHDEASGGGLADRVVREICASPAFWDLDAPIEVVTAPATPIPAGPALEDAYVVTRARLSEALQRLTAGR
jgi:2-oxoisovalerate dehydrogenase E1 component